MTILSTSPWRGFGASLRPSIIRDLARSVVALADYSHWAIVDRLVRRPAVASAPSPIIFTSIDGSVRMVITTVDAYWAEPKGAKYDVCAADDGLHLSYLEPIPATA